MGKKIQRIGRYTLDGVTLGWGNFAKVDLATHEITRVKVAIKIIDTKKIKDEYVRTNLHREARIMACLKHPHIVRLYETLKATTLYCLVTEYITGGDLLDHIKSRENQRLDENSSRLFIRQLLSALAYLHERGIVHRDLKMENVLLDEKKKNIKIIDFGLSNVCKKHSTLRTHCGSPEYAAPELFIAGKTYGPEIDIWSLGVITYAMTLGKLPFSASNGDDYQKHKMLQQIQKGLSPNHEKDMQVLSASCRNLLHQLIEPQPQLRIPLLEIEKHSWITKNGKHPFFRFTAFPKSVVLRNQVIGELSYLSEIKKGILNDMVRERKSDEISAMFNMMLDKKKRDIGYFDMDHTKRPQNKSAEKTSTPESCKTTSSTLGRKAKTKKNTPRSELLPRRSNEARRINNNNTSNNSNTTSNTIGNSNNNGTRDDDPTTSDCRLEDKLESSTSQATPNDSCNLIFLSQPYFRHAQVPRSACTPPLKLSMTLDLSVANLSSKTDHMYSRPRPGEKHDYDSLHGVAASSGVPPRMSPKEESKPPLPLPPPPSRKPKRSTICSISFRKKLVFPCGMGSRETIPESGGKTERNNNTSVSCQGRNSCRPTTLFLKMKSKKSCLFAKSRETGRKLISTNSSSNNNNNSNAEIVVAPRASPESSFIDVSSSDDDDDGSSISNNTNNTNNDDNRSNWNVASSTPIDGLETSRAVDVREEAHLEVTRGMNFNFCFFSRRISNSLDCLLPTIRRYNNNNNNNNNNNIKVVSRQMRGRGKMEATTTTTTTTTPSPSSNHTKVPSNQIDFNDGRHDYRKILNFHSNNPDASLGSSSSPSFPVRELFGAEGGVSDIT